MDGLGHFHVDLQNTNVVDLQHKIDEINASVHLCLVPRRPKAILLLHSCRSFPYSDRTGPFAFSNNSHILVGELRGGIDRIAARKSGNLQRIQDPVSTQDLAGLEVIHRQKPRNLPLFRHPSTQ
jgi:hypothetical protein